MSNKSKTDKLMARFKTAVSKLPKTTSDSDPYAEAAKQK